MICQWEGKGASSRSCRFLLCLISTVLFFLFLGLLYLLRGLSFYMANQSG